ncbi:MAG: hypothetical protein EA388_03965 [Nitriliruptor sp.]|nr:MAG: hypothetical protein EA388_03965 [Nitriliruptor sp.]
MSDVPNDPTAMSGQQGGDEPTEEEVRAYISQLRGAPVDQVIAEVSSALINAAQVKLGRKDGRLLLDVVGAVTEQLRGQVDDELPRQLDDVLAKLRMAQVEAEKEVAQQVQDEPNDLGSTPTAPGEASPAQAPGSPSAGASDGGSAASRLWTPGS